MFCIYAHQNYREIIQKAVLSGDRGNGKKFTFSNLAKACRVQRTYISAVVNERAHLSPDQIFDACTYLDFSDDEIQFTTLLMELERSSSAARKKRLAKEIEAIQKRNLKSNKYVPMEQAIDDLNTNANDFFLDVNAQLVHMYLTIPRFSNDLEFLRRVLRIPRKSLDILLAKITKAGLIRYTNNKISLVKDSFYLPSNSNLLPSFRTNMRLKAVETTQLDSAKTSYSFSVFYSADSKTFPVVQTKFFEFIKWVKEYTQGTKPTDVFQLNFDLINYPTEKHD